MEEQYWIRSCGKVSGPFAPDELRARARRGRFSRAHQVSLDGHSWQRATAFPELFPSPTTPQARIREEPIGARQVTPEPAGASEDPTRDPEVEQVLDSADDYPMDSTCTWQAQDSDEAEPLWHYSHNARQYGPVSFCELQELASTDHLAPGDLVWSEGMPDWAQAYRIPGVFIDPDAAAGICATAPAEPSAISAMAVGSFVLGLLGTTLLFFFGSIVAVVFGHVALHQIRASANTLGGRGMAVAGLVMGYTVIIATITVGVVVICVYLMQGIVAEPQ